MLDNAFPSVLEQWILRVNSKFYLDIHINAKKRRNFDLGAPRQNDLS